MGRQQSRSQGRNTKATVVLAIMAYMGGQEESIYCLIPPVIEPPPKPPLYRSKYPGTVPANKRKEATMGPLKVKAPEPDRYLKAYTREDNKLPEPRKFTYKDTMERKPAVVHEQEGVRQGASLPGEGQGRDPGRVQLHH